MKRLRKHKLYKSCGYIFLVGKLGHASAHKAKELKVDMETYPINNHHFLKLVKKLSSTLILPEYEVRDDMSEQLKVNINFHIEFNEFNLTDVAITAPVKFAKEESLYLKGELLSTLNLREGNYKISETGQKFEGDGYYTTLALDGLSIEVLNNMRKYK